MRYVEGKIQFVKKTHGVIETDNNDLVFFNSFHVRPRPPRDCTQYFSKGDVVEVIYGDWDEWPFHRAEDLCLKTKMGSGDPGEPTAAYYKSYFRKLYAGKFTNCYGRMTMMRGQRFHDVPSWPPPQMPMAPPQARGQPMAPHGRERIFMEPRSIMKITIPNENAGFRKEKRSIGKERDFSNYVRDDFDIEVIENDEESMEPY